MNARVIIRPAVREDLEAISMLRTEAILDSAHGACSRQQVQQWASSLSNDRMLGRIGDGCVLVGVRGNAIVATGILELEESELLGPFVKPSFQRQGLGKRMVAEIERLATQFGVLELRLEASLPSRAFFRSCRYLPRGAAAVNTNPETGMPCVSMKRAFPNRQTRYGRRIARLLSRIGIQPDYGRSRALRLQAESRELATVGVNGQGKEHLLHPLAAMAWYGLRDAAMDDGVELNVVSAYRSVGHQVALIERKRQAGQSIEEILDASAAPGYSEHHTGFALDVTCPGSPPLQACFENTDAFEWLTQRAHQFRFAMSYPRNNRHGIAYEPWHWRYCP